MSAAPARFSLIESQEGRDRASFAGEVGTGLAGDPKRIPCRFLYDEVGSRLFEEICELPEYYVTRTEREILVERADAIAGRFDCPITLVELGSGSSTKTRLLFEAFLRRHGRLRYVPVDISRSVLEASALELLERYRSLEIRAIVSEYSAGLRHVGAERERPKLVVWLGSNIGNLGRAEAAEFLGRLRRTLAPADRLLLGIDLRKPAPVLEAAYDDSRGVTARFSLNLLERVNRELGGHFDPARFRHRARYLEVDGRVVIELVSTRAQTVSIDDLGLALDFAEGECIHVEDSYKYSPREIRELAGAADLRLERAWQDAGGRFRLSLLAPRT